jgi:hypothetical protein
MPTVTQPPPTRAAPSSPRRDADVEALIKEARRRQRKRQALIATGVLAVAAAVAIAVKGLTGGGAESRRAAARPGAGARASVTTPFAVGAATSMALRGGKVVQPRKQWAGLVIARPAAQSCTRVALPHSGVDIVFSGRRYAYQVGGNVIAVGVVGRGRPHRIVARYQTWPQSPSISPAWVDRRLGLLESNAPRFHLAGRRITFHVPPGAQFGGILAASHGRIMYDVSWQNEWGTAVAKTATFVYANGVTKLVRQIRHSPVPWGVEASWSPNGSRIAFLERGELWTMRADGSDPRRLTSTPTIAKMGPLLWSPDGKTIVYDAVQHQVSDVYAIPAGGGEPRQLTHSKALPPPVNGGGTRPLVWLGSTALAVASGNSLGVVDLAGGAVHTICTFPLMSFGSATALG